jgi:hypothetical protein
MGKFYNWLDEQVNYENRWIREDYGVAYFFCTDSIIDDWLDSGCVTVEEYEEDNMENLQPLFEDWSMEAKPFDYTDKDIQRRINEDNAELHTRSMEMGWGGSFVSNSRGQRTYFPYDDY